MMNTLEVNGLPLPQLLIELIQNSEWQHPGDEVIRSCIDYLHEPIDFLSIDQMHFESSGFLADDEKTSLIFHGIRGSKQNKSLDLPWLDVEKSFFIAVNRYPGADLGIALDYRTDMTNPRVIASNWHSSPDSCIWQEVSSTFSQFIELINLAKRKS